LSKIPSWLIWAFAIVSFLGFIDASYLAINHYTGAELTCSLLEGCDQVTTSEYSTIFGIPVALGGTFFYLTIFILTMIHVDTKKIKPLKLLPPLTMIGFLCSLYFTYLQAFVIEAFCQYCLLSAITSTTLLILSFFLLKPLKLIKSS